MKNGFTIIELIISIFILSVAVVGIFSALSVITILTSNSSNRLTAAYLAQEGMEIVRNIRDTNWLTPGTNWLYDFLPCEKPAYGCEVDYKDMASGIKSYGDYLHLNNTSGFYTYDTNNASPTIFKRKITITCLPNGDCGSDDYLIKVAVRVCWDEKANILYSGRKAEDCMSSSNITPTNGITAEETLYNWYASPVQP